jgi:hypothetical protein
MPGRTAIVKKVIIVMPQEEIEGGKVGIYAGMNKEKNVPEVGIEIGRSVTTMTIAQAEALIGNIQRAITDSQRGFDMWQAGKTDAEIMDELVGDDPTLTRGDALEEEAERNFEDFVNGLQQALERDEAETSEKAQEARKEA